MALADIEGAVTASQDFWEGRTISSMAVNEIAGGTCAPRPRWPPTAQWRSLYAMARIEDGDQHLNLVLAHCQGVPGEPHSVELAGFDPYFERALDPDETIAAALQAELYYRRSGLGPEDARAGRGCRPAPLRRARAGDAPTTSLRLPADGDAAARARPRAADGHGASRWSSATRRPRSGSAARRARSSRGASRPAAGGPAAT